MGVFDASTPTGSDLVSQGDDRIRELKVALEEAFSEGGVFPGANPLTAPIFYPTFPKDTLANRPAASADYPGRLYRLSDDVQTLQRVKDDGSAWEDVAKNPEKQAIHTPVGSALASALGIVTLPETGNTFVVSGAEEVTSIAGWSAGIVVIQWTAARNIKHSATLAIKNSVSRKVVANDVSTFMFNGAGSVVEIAFHGAGSGYDVGDSKMMNSEAVPAGFLEENGASYLRTDYPGLFAVIGTAHGAADGTHFNVPKTNGRTVRGWDHGAGVDPDAAARTAAAAGGATGDHVGTVQADQVGPHTHTVTDPGHAHPLASNGSGDGVNALNTGAVGSEIADGVTRYLSAFATGVTVNASTGTESRGKNATKMYCIKY